MPCFNLYDTQHHFSVPFNSDRIHHPHLRSQPTNKLARTDLSAQRDRSITVPSISCNHTK
ncbi:hypothetical protein H6F50_12075 [Coleofasciculus sp. FACHB-712]|uniref:hypothetical protein n=1 Tax=Coleofasciculus sp. FACHB-712 TaxID=2692789 RepID=UPI001689E3C1|nr:hypothetical protein [Coleofasciculus sp. FACHB-712]MBD1943090.1 hypothetical protein [Coleofasciculus sp. FACHB-712]